jgi:hypothetical protein
MIPTPAPDDRRSFPHFIVRAVGWYCLIDAISALGNPVIQCLQSGFQYPNQSDLLTLFTIQLTASVFKLIGAIQLLRWKPSGRHLLRIWAWTAIGMTLISQVLLFRYLRPRVTDSAASRDDIFWAVHLGWGWLGQCLLPLFVYLILSRREIAHLFTSTSATGFEVVPMAQGLQDPK